MFQADVLTAYLNCGISALAGAAMLRLARTDDARLRRTLRLCGWALVTLGVGLMPASLGDGARHPAAQFAMTFGTLFAVLLMSRGIGQLQGRNLRPGTCAAATAAIAAGMMLALDAGLLALGATFAVGLAAASTLMAWMGQGFIRSPRTAIERVFGWVLLLVVASSWIRMRNPNIFKVGNIKRALSYFSGFSGFPWIDSDPAGLKQRYACMQVEDNPVLR